MKKIISAVIGIVVVLSALQFMWLWGFCRFYVGPNKMAIITAKNGDITTAPAPVRKRALFHQLPV